MENFLRDFLLAGGPQARAEGEHEEEGVSETMHDELTTIRIPHTPGPLVRRI